MFNLTRHHPTQPHEEIQILRLEARQESCCEKEAGGQEKARHEKEIRHDGRCARQRLSAAKRGLLPAVRTGWETPLKPLPKLGKKPARHDPRTLYLREFLRAEHLPAFPPAHQQAHHVRRWSTLGNRRLQNCTCAAAGHLIHAWTARVGSAVILPTHSVVKAYSKITGYNARTGANDDGADLLTVLNFWRKAGFDGHRIEAFVGLDRHHPLHIRAGVILFGGVYVGLSLPRSAHGQKVWHVPTSGPTGDGKPDSWGGHVVPVIGYDEHGLTAITWGRRQRMTWGFLHTYSDEAYAVLGADLLDGQAAAPAGVDLAALRGALSDLK